MVSVSVFATVSVGLLSANSREVELEGAWL